jgi:hypothetical protein
MNGDISIKNTERPGFRWMNGAICIKDAARARFRWMNGTMKQGVITFADDLLENRRKENQ